MTREYVRAIDGVENTSVVLCVLLWAQDGCASELTSYEDAMLELLLDHGGRVVNRALTSGMDGQPLEIQFLEFPHPRSLEGYLSDERRIALTEMRDRVVARTEIIPVELI